MKTWMISVSVATALIAGGVQAQTTGDAAAGESKVAVCLACHGPNGNSLVPMFPKLASQHSEYLVKELTDFKSGARTNDQMTPQAALINENDIPDIAAYYSAQQQTAGTADPALAKQGERIYRAGNPATGVPACSGCHGPAGLGMGAAKFPRIAGQQAQYVDTTLKSFRAGTRTNDPNGMMQDVAGRISDAEIAAVSQFLQGFPQQ
jgi:cytochrome c553